MFDLTQLGWNSFFKSQLTDAEWEEYLPGRVALIHQSLATIWTAEGEEQLEVKRFKDPKDVIVGDWVRLPKTTQPRIFRLDRQNELSRWAPGGQARTQLIAANIDRLFIVTSCNQDFTESRIERYLALAAENGLETAIILTKADLTDNADEFKQRAQTIAPNVFITCVDARAADQLTDLQTHCPRGETTALMGASGVGKSTLINSMADADQFTWEVSEFDGKGQHSTTARSLHPLQGGGLFLDTPGTREIQLAACDNGIDAVFPDVVQCIEACRFGNCSHQGDSGCGVEEALSNGSLCPNRWERYQQLKQEQTKYYAALALGEKRKQKSRKRR